MCGDWLRLVWDLFFPRFCAVCGRELLVRERHLCLECYAGLPLTYFWRIRDNPAEEVFWGRVRTERVYSLFYYQNNYRKPLHRLKYRSDRDIGIWLGKMLGERIEQDILRDGKGAGPVDYVVPVPLHYRKRWKRGYNQSAILAKGIIRGLAKGNPSQPEPQLISNLLVRKQFTTTQTKKDRLERWKNVSGAFRINPRTAARLKGERKPHLLLVDDVLTTGATLEACAALLQQNLDCYISIATLAYVE